MSTLTLRNGRQYSRGQNYVRSSVNFHTFYYNDHAKLRVVGRHDLTAAVYIVIVVHSKHYPNKSDISCLKNQSDAFPAQCTQLSLGQAIKLQL